MRSRVPAAEVREKARGGVGEVDERHEALALDYLEQVLEVRVLGRD